MHTNIFLNFYIDLFLYTFVYIFFTTRRYQVLPKCIPNMAIRMIWGCLMNGDILLLYQNNDKIFSLLEREKT